MKIKKAILLLGSIFWPLGLYLTNQPYEFLTYTPPALLILISYFLYKKGCKSFPLPLLLIPIIDTKLSVFPLFVSTGLFFISRSQKRINILFIILPLFLLLFNIKTFTQQSIFKLEYEKKQEVLREIHLYPNPLFARIFQNKARIVTDKLSTNLTALIDPGNYFFGFHPREGVVNNQNLIKYPFLAIIPILIGLFNFNKLKYHKYILLVFISGILSLSLLENFDRSDFLLWFPITVFLIHGTKIIFKTKNKIWPILFSLAFIANCLIEFLRIPYHY